MKQKQNQITSLRIKWYIQYIACICCVMLVAISNSVIFAQSNKKIKAVNNLEANKTINSSTSSSTKVPYMLEINEDSARNGAVITLAVNAITIIRCPEEPVNFYLGSTIGIDAFQAAEFDKELGRNEIYVRPRIAGTHTNLVIEFASGPMVIYFKVLELKNGNNAGDFTGEVVIKNIYYKDKLADTEKQLLASNEENTSLKTKIAELEKQLQEKVSAACQEDKLTTLRLIEDSIVFVSEKNTVQQGSVRISQVGRVQRVKTGFVISFALENRSKDFLSLDQLTSPSGNILTTWALPKRLSPKATTKTSLLIETEDLKEIPSEITFLVSGTPLKLKPSY